MRFSPVEESIFALLLAVSLAGFVRPFVLVVRRVLSAKPDADFQIRPLGKRIRDFVWEVLLQGKVIRQRPAPGLAHAFVFWGFCVFALVTLNHVAAGFNAAFLLGQSRLGRAYFAVAAIFAVFVAISIAALFIRRFFIRPPWLGHLSPESGAIALLIFALMATYLASFVVADNAPEAKLLWALHSAALLIFLPLIPYTKHLHLVLSPVSVFLSRGSFAKIPPLSGDEDFGLETGKDITRVVALQAYSCVECGRCTEHCPAFNTGKTLDPKEISLGLRGYLNEFGTADGPPLLGTHLSQEAAFQCTTCGACEFQCPVGVEHVPIIVGLRRGAVNTGKWEDEYGTKLFLALERNGSALGLSSGERDRFIEKQRLPIFDGSQEYCLWLGCMGAYDPGGREIVASLARLMSRAETSFGVLRQERCTGDPARRLGNDLLFEQLARHNLETIEKARVSRIISICPHCVRTIGVDWKEHGEAPSIEHHSEFLARHRQKLPPAPNGSRIVYHDPCYLGRYRGVYGAPRELISSPGQTVDPPRARERAFCCGAGGGLAFLGEEKGERVSHNRARELAATGAQIVAAACPFCNTMFRDALPAVSANPPKLLDIAQILDGGL